MLAMEKYDRLLELWQTISNEQVYTGGFNLLSLLKILYGKRSFYGNEPLWRRLQGEVSLEMIRADLRVGAVSLMSGEYIQFRRDDPELVKAVLASTVMPVIWDPVDVSPEHIEMVDGGVRNVSPLGDVLKDEPDEIVVINCFPRKPDALLERPKNVVQVGLRALDLLLNELFQNDLREFLRINELVRQAEKRGVTLVNPGSGKPYKYYACSIIEPEYSLGETLDFSQETIQRSLAEGVRRARDVIGR
jgi:NTE family protein